MSLLFQFIFLNASVVVEFISVNPGAKWQNKLLLIACRFVTWQCIDSYWPIYKKLYLVSKIRLPEKSCNFF